VATGRIGVTPTLRTRWSKAPAGGTTSLSGLDDNSVSLVYDVGYEAVYRNGVLLSRTNDYTATTGNSITLIDATIAGDIIEVFANQVVPLNNVIGNGQFTAKGALLSASAASTPAVLAVGSNDQVLTADSSTATGLKWATPAAGGKVLQVVQATYATQTTVASTTFTDTGLSASITPSSSSSKVLVLVTQSLAWTRDRDSGGANLKLLRGSTTIFQPNAGAYALLMNQIYIDTSATENFLSHSLVQTFNYLDSPATTSSTTYKTQQAAYDTGYNGTSITNIGGGTSSIILLEIGA
jgi:hypothetical protein